MGETRFTPGPWRFDKPSNWHGLAARVYVAEPYGEIAQVPIEAWRPKSVGMANARLIAAAPQMYKALQDIIDVCDQSNGGKGVSLPILLNIRSIAASALAEGKNEEGR